jgi:molecular chaperone GrpE
MSEANPEPPTPNDVEAAMPSDPELVETEHVIEADIADIAAIAQQRDEYLALAQGLQAVFENYKKQTIRRNTEVLENASARLAEKLLPVLDAFDNAIIQGVEGVSPIYKALIDVLEKEGLEVVPTDGVPFDPNQHEAVMHEPADEGDEQPMVSETLRTGYSWKGRVLRPAMVKVRG